MIAPACKKGDKVWVYWIGKPARGEVKGVSAEGRIEICLSRAGTTIGVAPAYGIFRTRKDALLAEAKRGLRWAKEDVAAQRERLRHARVQLSKAKAKLAKLRGGR